MKIGIFTRGSKSHSYVWETAFANGLQKHGHKVSFYNMNDRPLIDMGVLWGVHNQGLIDWFELRGTNYVVLERGYIGDRHKWTSCGFNGLNGRADFLLEFANEKRLGNVREYLKPLKKKNGDDIIIMGQIATDASVKKIGFRSWFHETLKEIRAVTDRKVYYRPHPLDTNTNYFKDVDILHDSTLQEVLDRAHCVVTLNSNSGVDAVLNGTPAIACNSGSMVYDIVSNNLENVVDPYILPRIQWLEQMSYCQWTIEEIQEGKTWNHLRRFYET